TDLVESRNDLVGRDAAAGEIRAGGPRAAEEGTCAAAVEVTERAGHRNGSPIDRGGAPGDPQTRYQAEVVHQLQVGPEVDGQGERVAHARLRRHDELGGVGGALACDDG